MQQERCGVDADGDVEELFHCKTLIYLRIWISLTRHKEDILVKVTIGAEKKKHQ